MARSFFRLCAASFFVVSLCAACAPSPENGVVYCPNDEYSAYPSLLSQILPAYTVKTGDKKPFAYLDEGAAALAFEAQAVSALEAGTAKYWYPQCLATLVIAVDRERTDAVISGWNDLPAAKEEIGVCLDFSSTRQNIQMLFAAIARGLEGEHYTMKGTARFLAAIYADGRLIRNSFEPPILICYDYQAAALLRQGRRLEVIVPAEGTYTYEKGILSNTPLSFSGGTDALLVEAGFRLTGGRCDASLYPADYGNAHRVSDYKHFNRVAQNAQRLKNRIVMRIDHYGPTDDRENQLFALFYIVVLIVVTASVIQRAMLKGVRRASLAAGVILFGWISVRLIKYQLDVTTAVSRYFWYSYYLFQLALPLVLLWLAWVIDKGNESNDKIVKPPRWLAGMAVINAIIFALVFTNDFHMLAFPLDVNSLTFASDYGYGPIFYLLLAGSVLPLVPAVFLLLRKARGNTRKAGFVFPLVFCVLLAAYGFGYARRVPIAWGSDITMVICIFTLLFSESLIRCGLIPVNTKYATLFRHSPLGMRIKNRAGKVALASAVPLTPNENTLVFTAPITGGEVQWQEDISGLNRLYREIEEQATRLAAANTLLGKQEKIRRALDGERAKKELTAQLDAEIAAHIKRLEEMIEYLSGAEASGGQAGRAALLLCYIKQRCSLFFQEEETKTPEPVLAADELAVLLDELAEIGGLAGIQTVVSCELKAEIPLRRATLFYDFFYSVMDWAHEQDLLRILAHLGPAHGKIILSLWPATEAPAKPAQDIRRSFTPDASLVRAIGNGGGVFAAKENDCSMCVSLSFPDGSSSPGGPQHD